VGGDAHQRPLAGAVRAGRGELASAPVGAALEARFLRRYKRFFADVETADGEKLTVHCANPGSMLGFDRPGARVRCSHSDAPTRKLAYTLEMMRVGRAWVGLHTGRANAVVAAALQAGLPRALAGYSGLRREVVVPWRGERPRLDFRLEAEGRPPVWLEVKSATLAEGRLARFPDSVTLRGRRHLELLAALRKQGERAALLFLVQRADCDAVAPADAIDPAYGEALRRAAAQGVELYALGARVSPRGIRVERELPVRLS
jgi:sugar fermentation stimulation protein A